MFIGHISRTTEEERLLPPIIRQGLDFLRNNDLTVFPEGRYEICGDDLFATIADYTTEPKKERRAESHKEYIDIQYIVHGEEILGWSALSSKNIIIEDCRPERDLIFYENAIHESDIRLMAGMYAVLFPEDVHRPCCQDGVPVKVRKVVVKVAVKCIC